MSTNDKLMEELRQAQEEFKKMDSTAEVAEAESAETTESSSEVHTEQHSEPQYSEIEKQAIEQGWNPNYEGADKKSAEQYVKDGSFFRKIDAQKKEINELKDAFKQLSSHQKKVEKAAYEKALAEIKATRDAAIEVGDVVKVNALDDHIQQHKENIRRLEQETSTQQPQAPHQAALDFQERNKTWFGNFDKNVDPNTLDEDGKANYRMTKAATTYDEYLGMKVSSGQLKMTPEEAIKAVEDFIKETYPDKFKNPKKEAPQQVLTSTSHESGSAASKLTSRMTDRQKQQYKMFLSVDPKFGSIEDFAKHLDLIGELKK